MREQGRKAVVVILPAAFNRLHAAAIHKYFRAEHNLTGDEWRILLDAMDLLRRATIHAQSGAYTFAGVYQQFVEYIHADTFIEQLLNMKDIAPESSRLRAQIASQILDTLRQAGLYVPTIPETQLLAAFCAYWWHSFAKGYAFEVTIFKHLANNGIDFEAHDIHTASGRRSPHDLIVMGFRGDIRTSTYFLHMRRAAALPHDFYVTRLYNSDDRRWEKIVLLREACWRALNGDLVLASWETVWRIFPRAALVEFNVRKMVVVQYETWKQRVLACRTER